ncbi:hypothetical protein E2542_SST05087 [Spatholobus suberectus]|nr:hypothetical protein E2542_SST05087 [Spatholobus suberectus]
MASRPGILTDWPWKPLGSFKYLLLAPWVVHISYSVLMKDKTERDISTFLILPFLLWRMLHNQIWITLSRYRTAKGNARIVDKGIEFDQVDREREWDDQILFNGLLYYLGCYTLPGASRLPLWRTDGSGYDNTASYWTSGVSLLLVTQSTSSSLSLLSIPFSPPFFHCHRTHYFCHPSICRTHIIFSPLLNTHVNPSLHKNSFCGGHGWICHLH